MVHGHPPTGRRDGVSITVVLGEDNVLVREGVRALLDSYDDIEVVGVAEDAPSLLVAAADHVPDVVVTDIKMPPSFQLEGIDCAHAIREQHPDTGVVVLSAHDDEEYAIALLGRGHSGLAYLLKDRIAQGDELARAIREVHAGGSTVDPTIAERLSGRGEAAERDRELLDMMAKGLGYEEIAAALGTTQEAVDRQVTELFRGMAGGRGLGRPGRRVQAAAFRGRRADRLAQHARELRAAAARRAARLPSRDRDRAAGGRGDRAVQRHPGLLDDRGTARGPRRRRGRGPAPRGDGRGRGRARRHDRQVPGRRRDGGLRRARAVARSRRTRAAVCDRDAAAAIRAERGRLGCRGPARDGRRDRGEHRSGDRRHGGRRRASRVHGRGRRREHRLAAAERGGRRRDRRDGHARSRPRTASRASRSACAR